LTVGTFDGVHRGHQKILEQLTFKSGELNGEPTVLTFDPHPRKLLFPGENNLLMLSTTEEKIELFERFGIEHLIIMKFDIELSKLNSQEFIEKILVQYLQIQHLIVGYDHRFGNDRMGNFETIRQYAEKFGFTAEKINALSSEGTNISSTKIRTLLAAGEITSANHLLGYDYSITGKVVEGYKIGRTIGFPTANIEISDSGKLVPADGVYAVEVSFENFSYGGMLNIGNRPTFNGTRKTIEVHIFDFIDTVYEKEITIRFKKFIRAERKFNSVEELIHQLKDDKNTTENYFESLILK
jgi:riboflavin kinase/FMN adenylyltransferase